MHAGMRFGIFMAPQHKPEGNPTLALQRDLELIEHLDVLGFDEAWIGEHHSAGSEIIASPEVFIANAAARTSQIRLGTGVVSVPYHHPYMTAERMVLLDHLTRGRVMLGVGPGALPTDAAMLGIDPLVQRERLAEGLDVILRLLRTEEPITVESEWFTMTEALLHLRPYTHPHLEVAVAAVASPTGWGLGGKHGIGVLGVAATTEKGFEALETSWGITEQQAQEHGHTAERNDLRLVGIIHIAETREQAIEDVRFGLDHYVDYFQQTAAFPQLGFAGDTFEERVEYVNESGLGSVGTVEAAIDQVSRLEEQAGGFGCFLILAHEWANLEATRRSYELFARYVMPHFQGSNRSTRASEQRARNQRQSLFERHQQALDKASTAPAR